MIDMVLQDYLKFLLLVVVVVFETWQEGSFYTNEDAEVSEEAVIKRWAGISSTSCVLHCKQNKECQMAALTDSECLLLKNATDDAKDANDTVKVTLLKRIDTKKKPPENIVDKESTCRLTL